MVATERAIERFLDDLRSLEHDVLHQLSTIGVLAELLGAADLPGPQRELRAHQLRREIRWLHRLVQSERSRFARDYGGGRSRDFRLDVLVADVLTTVRLMTPAAVHLVVEPVGVRADRTAVGRAVRNLVWNAVDAAGPNGELRVAVRVDGCAAVVEIDNDVRRRGPKPDGHGIGVELVRQIAAAAGGTLRMETGVGRHHATLRLPTAPAEDGELCAS